MSNTKTLFEQRAEAMYPYPDLENQVSSGSWRQLKSAIDRDRENYIKGLQENVGGLVEALEQIVHGPSDRLSHSIAHKALIAFPNTNEGDETLK